MRMSDGTPVLFTASSAGPVELDRVSPQDTSVLEHQIQEIVFEHPSVLPIEALDSAFAPAIPVGREIGTAVGPVDALFVSPDGGITVVEAKLWRNPEARRAVVGQVLDYATALSSWSYEALDRACRNSTRQTLFSRVRSQSGEDSLHEATFVDAVARNLQAGRFLLLIVGDGIREEVERMAAYVQSTPRLQFQLALVELRIFDSDAGDRVIVPSVVARTSEIVRAVVHVDVAEEARVEVDVTVPVDDSPSSRRQLTIEEFFAEMEVHADAATVDFARDVLESFAADHRFKLQRRASAISLRLRNPMGGPEFTVLVFEKVGRAYPGWLTGQCRRAGVPEETGLRFAADLSQLVGIPVHHQNGDTLASPVPLATLEARWEEIDERIERLVQEIYEHLG
jgi:hypothetical protein